MSKKTAPTRPAGPRKSDRALTHLRAQVRAILLEDGTAIAPGSQTPERIDALISEQATRYRPTLDRTSEALVERVRRPNREDAALGGGDLALTLSDHHGSIMCAYGDAGYFVGLAAGLELAALTAGGGESRVGPRRHRGAR